jgi:hypothetical protein
VLNDGQTKLSPVPESTAFPPRIKTIRALLKTADIPVAEIAARFGIAWSTLYALS